MKARQRLIGDLSQREGIGITSFGAILLHLDYIGFDDILH